MWFMISFLPQRYKHFYLTKKWMLSKVNIKRFRFKSDGIFGKNPSISPLKVSNHIKFEFEEHLHR